MPWPQVSGVRTTREPPGSTEVASVTGPSGIWSCGGWADRRRGNSFHSAPSPPGQGPRAGRLQVSPDGEESAPAPGSQRCGQWPGPARGPCTFSSPALLLCPGNERGRKRLSLLCWLEHRWMRVLLCHQLGSGAPRDRRSQTPSGKAQGQNPQPRGLRPQTQQWWDLPPAGRGRVGSSPGPARDCCLGQSRLCLLGNLLESNFHLLHSHALRLQCQLGNARFLCTRVRGTSRTHT